MYKSPKRGKAARPNDSLNRFKQPVRAKVSTGIEVLHPPLKASQRKSRSIEKTVVSRCCNVSPDTKNFGQYFGESSKTCYKDAATGSGQPDEDYQSPNVKIGKPAIVNLKEPRKKVSRSFRNKMKSYPHYSSSRGSNTPQTFDESQWQKLDSPEDVDSIFGAKDNPSFDHPAKQMFISEVPHIKVIAEKFSKFKRGNVELRRLDEKVVCVEYDVFDQGSNHEVLKPVQRMRTYFSIKPFDNDSDKEIPSLPPNIKNEFDVLEEDFEKLTEKEIEFIDDDIEENQSYLDDLRRILKRKEVLNTHKNKTSLDLQCLYEMAKRDGRPVNTDYLESNFLTQAELQEVKQLILQRCTSTIDGFRRRTIKKQEPSPVPGVISDNIMTEMLRCET
ncbi:hypothetical protein PYW07_003419 [Mythimna separata]|uniref:Uncharacterized protein n=1 Tax=Mythimna separata TaxID=271217 RepID=A0AAD7YHW4_MYTSE|nr:hypothetical protein PYW07_003419 [Mythimna separata]